MKKQIAVFLGLILTLSAVDFAQTKTVTNSDLERFRQKRLQSEREYRNNYARLGFPSPEELERKRIEDEKSLVAYSQQLESQRLERETLQAEAQNQALWSQNQYRQSQNGYANYDSGGYISGGYLPYYSDYYSYNRSNRRRGFYGRYKNTYNDPYPWLISPGFREQRILSSRPSRFLPPRNLNPQIKVRTGRGRH
ncbi:MAG: hypothetical protein ABIP06_04695 [Pyrinomonadaceae bacterium]